MFICIYMYIDIYLHTFIYVYIYIYMYIFMYLHVCIYIYTYIYLYTYIYKYVYHFSQGLKYTPPIHSDMFRKNIGLFSECIYGSFQKIRMARSRIHVGLFSQMHRTLHPMHIEISLKYAYGS